jgi:hypothetical protein
MATWLYPISKGAGRWFCLDDGTRCKVSVKNYARLVRNGRLPEDKWWSVSANFREAQVGEEVFIYTGDENLGIIGYAKIREVDRTNRRFYLAFDLKRCEKLFDAPIPASLIRGWIHFPRRPVVDLTSHLSKLNSLLPWKGGRIRKETERIVQRVTGAGFGVDHERKKKIELAAIRAVTKYYRSKGWSVDPTYQTKRLGFDLLCSKGSKIKKVEVKGVFGGNVCFIMTAGERKNSQDKNFILHVVYNALSKHPIIKGWTGQQMEKNFAFAEINYLASLKN